MHIENKLEDFFCNDFLQARVLYLFAILEFLKSNFLSVYLPNDLSLKKQFRKKKKVKPSDANALNEKKLLYTHVQYNRIL
jgi:hypothetical protein